MKAAVKLLKWLFRNLRHRVSGPAFPGASWI